MINVTANELQSLSDAYETAEATYFGAVANQLPRLELADSARRCAETAAAFNAEAYRKLHAKEEDAWMPLDLLTERTEVLSELWTDLAAAYE